MTLIGEYPELPAYLIRELHRRTRQRVMDRAWQIIADKSVSVFEGYKSLTNRGQSW